jgi:hypothetical protein
MGMFHHYDLGYAEVFIFDEFLVNQVSEGITIRPEHNKKLKEIIDKHFTNKPLVYIGNRHFSYAVDPLTYIGTSKIHNLLAMAIVTTDEVNRKNAFLEKYFYDKPFEVFPTLSKAMAWVHEVVLENKRENSEKDSY